MSYLLDTNTCIAFLRGKNSDQITARLRSASPGEIALCSIVKAELLYGAQRSVSPQKNQKQLQHFFAGMPSYSFDDRAAEEYGKLRAKLAAMGTPIGPNDLLIAAIALANDVVLVTRNTAEFSRVSGLKMEDWETE